MFDEIIHELWRTKDKIDRQFQYNIDTLAVELKKQQDQSNRKVVNLVHDHIQQTTKQP